MRDANGNLLTLSGSPIRVGTTSIWQYAFTGSLADGTYTVTFLAGSFGDTSGITNQAASETFTVSEATTTLTAPPTGGVENQADLNGRGWVDVTFPTVNGSAVLASSITSGTALFTLTDAAGDHLVIDGSPVLIDVSNSTYRFFFTGDESGTAASQITLTFIPGSWQDANRDPVTSANFPSTSQYTITLGSWIDITLNPTAGATVNAGSFTGGLLTLSGPGVGTAAPLTGPNAVVQIGNPAANEYRVLVTGTFGTGQVNVAFAAGGWTDSAGNASIAGSGATFSIVAPAQDFFIELSGGLILNAPGVSDPLLSITADIKLVIDPARGLLTLTFSGQMSVIELGTVGATSGFFVLDTGAGFSNGPQLWGVASMQTNFSKLQALGLTIFASAYLEINTTGTEHVETISLAGLGPGGGPLVQTYDLQPFTFAVALAGELKVSIPQTSVTLLDVNGGFFLSLSEDEEVLYATGSTIYGQATGLIIIRTGAEGEHAGVAGLLTVGKSEGLDIPGIGSIFSISGSVTIAFNTTSQDQTFTIPQMFVPLLPVGAPTTITVFGSQPGLDGQPAGNPPGPYLQATVQAQITIGGILTMNGFIQITAGVFGSGANAVADLQLVGAVGTTIPFLGALSGEINFIVILGAHPGVVGRAELALGSNQIPGVSFQGQFLLEINTFGAQKSVTTFAINNTANGFGSFVSCTNGTAGCVDGILTDTETISAGPYFHIFMGGHLIVGSVVDIQGTLSFTIALGGSDPSISLLVNGSVTLGPLGSINLTNSGFRIDSQGLVARLQLSVGTNFGQSIGLSFNVTAIMSLNTSSRTQTLGTSSVAPGFDLFLSGSVTFGSFASASGSIDVAISQNQFQLTFAVAFTLGPLNFSANGGALIYSGGIALSLQVTASADADVFSIDASGLLQINTGSQTELGIAGNSFQLQLTGSVSILKVLNFNASMDVIVAGGAWQFSTNATVDFFGIFTLNGSIFLDSAGDFSVSLSGGVDFGCCGFGISGGFFITITSTHDPQTGAYFFNAAGGVSADLEAFGIDFGGVSFSFGVSVSSANGGSAPLILDTEASVHILFVHVHFHLHFTIGYIQLPPPVYMGGSDSSDDPNNVTAAETFNGGELYLNVGNLAPLRNIAGDSTNDTYLIKQIGGTAQSATIQVTAFGRTDTYQNVTGISGDWSGQQGCSNQTDPSDGTTFNTCQDTIIVDPSVLVPLTLKGSPGDDVIEYEGNNDATQIWGEGGNNQIFATGPSGVTIFGDAPGVVSTGQNIINHSGTGAARITPGGGGDDITVDSPTDLVFAAAGNNIINGVAQEIDTGNGINTINLSPQGSPVIVDNTGGGQDTLNFTIPSGTATISGTGTATNDYTVVYAGPLASGSTTYTITGVQTLVLTGSADTTAFNGFNVTLQTLTLTTPGAFTLQDSTIATTGTAAASGADLTITAATAVELTQTSLTSADGAVLTVSAGDLTIDTASSISTAGALTASATGGVTVQDGSTLRTSAGAVSLSAAGQLTISGSTVSATGGGVSLSAPGGVTISQENPPAAPGSPAPAPEAASISATGANASVVITAGTLTSPAALTITNASVSSAAGAITLTSSAATNLTGAALSAATGISATAQTGLTVAAGTGAGSFTASGTGATISLTATTGLLSVSGATVSAVAGSISLVAQSGSTTIDADTMTGGTGVSASATQNVTVQGGSMTAGLTGPLTLSAGQNLTVNNATLRSGGAATFTATAGAQTWSGTALTVGSATATAATTISLASTRLTSAGTVTVTATGTGVSSGASSLTLNSSRLVSTGGTVTVTTVAGQLTITNSSTVSANGAATLTAQAASLTIFASSVSGASATVLAQAGSETIGFSSVTATSQDATLTASLGLTETNSQITAGNDIALTAQGGDILVDPSTNRASSGSITDSASGSYTVENSTYTAARRDLADRARRRRHPVGFHADRRDHVDRHRLARRHRGLLHVRHGVGGHHLQRPGHDDHRLLV